MNDIIDLVNFLEDNIPRLVRGEAESLNFTGTSISPSKLDDALCHMGYWFDYDDENGWEHDCWHYYSGPAGLPPVTMFYCGYAFTLKLYLTVEEK